jgi:hypothetical protein
MMDTKLAERQFQTMLAQLLREVGWRVNEGPAGIVAANESGQAFHLEPVHLEIRNTPAQPDS